MSQVKKHPQLPFRFNIIDFVYGSGLTKGLRIIIEDSPGNDATVKVEIRGDIAIPKSRTPRINSKCNLAEKTRKLLTRKFGKRLGNQIHNAIFERLVYIAIAQRRVVFQV